MCFFVDCRHLQGQGSLWVDPEGKILFLRGAASSVPRMKTYQLTRCSVLNMPDPSDTRRAWASQSNELKEDSQAWSGPFLSIKHQVCPWLSFRCWGWNPHGAFSLVGQRGKHKSSKQNEHDHQERKRCDLGETGAGSRQPGSPPS